MPGWILKRDGGSEMRVALLNKLRAYTLQSLREKICLNFELFGVPVLSQLENEFF